MKSKTSKLIMVCLSAIALMIMSVIVMPVAIRTVSAAAEPALNKTSRNILVGKTYNLNVNNKIKGAKYVWSTSDKKIANVNNKGIVTGKKKGTATITCTITTKDKKNYTLECKVNIIEPASYFRIKNKVSALNLGQTYDFDRAIPKTSNDKTTWSTSDPTIANPDKNGVVTALKKGAVTITGKTLSGKTDSVTFKVIDKEGIVTNQNELDTLLESGVGLITIKTDEKVSFKIPRGNNERTKLVIDAPNADVTNSSKFASVEIKQIAANTYYENAVGNNIIVSGKQARIVVGPNAKVKIEVTAEGTKVTVENNGVVEEVVLNKGTELEITGSSNEPIPVVINDPDCKISSSVPLNVTAKAKAEITLLKGAEGTKIQVESEDAIPTIIGNVTVDVKVGSGEDAKTKPVTGQPIAGGGAGGGYTGGGSNPPVSSITLDAVLNDISSFGLTTVNGNTYTVDGILLALAKTAFNSTNFADTWKAIPSQSVTDNGKTINITGNIGDLSKTVSISGGKFDGRSYTVTAASTGFALTISSANNSVTIEKGANGKSITLKTASVADVLDLPTTNDFIGSISTINLVYKGSAYTIDVPSLATIKSLVSNETVANKWQSITSEDIEVNGRAIKITGAAESATKTVEFAGKSYIVTINVGSIIIKDSNGVTAYFVPASNNVTFSIIN